ncbi:MAG: sensor histidine kinase, partial [Flavisolibacter sp.]
MKLFTRYSRINVFSTVIIFLIASTAFYFTLRYVLIRQIDDDLRIEEREIKTFVEKFGLLPENTSVKDQVIVYTTINEPFQGRSFHSTFLKEMNDNDEEHFRQLVFGIRASSRNFKVSVSKSLEETDDMINSIVLITVITILAILVASFIINRVLLKRIWKPFYTSLERIRDFKVGSSPPLKFSPVNIDEFSHMNHAVEKLTSQAQLDYLSLKTFSENASHEIQTPIAIARSKLDLLIQDEKLTEEQTQAVQSAYNAIQKLARLNHSLLLLARIENHQYEDVQQYDVKKSLQQKLEDFAELWTA